MERRSLMDGISSGPAPKAAKAAGTNNTLKLSIAVALLVVAAGVISVYEGWIPLFPEEKPAPPTAEETQAVQQRQKEIDQRIQKGEAITNGAS
jgi:hypothetical protein